MDHVNDEGSKHDPVDGAIRRVVIAGGGTAGWMAAAYIAKRFERVPMTITVVDSSRIGTIGVGEATVPGIRDFFAALNLDERELLASTAGTIKLGIEFDGWKAAGERFFHPFGLYGAPTLGVAFHHYWLKMRRSGFARPIADFSLCTRLALSNRLLPPPKPPVADLLFFNWSVHFDASLFAAMLKRYALERGVLHHDQLIQAVETDQSGIKALRLDDGEALTADLFIDCTGLRSLLLGNALETPMVDWDHLLPCDRAVAIPTERQSELVPFTRSSARRAGWQWRIPLRHRTGNGYVYSSQHLSDDEALAELTSNLDGPSLAEPNLVRFRTGRRENFWVKNCVGIGLAAGFLEPLESTSISLIQTGLERLIDFWPTPGAAEALAAEYNRIGALEWERVRDFIQVHYVLNGRHDEPFWDMCRELNVSDSLRHRMMLWKERGRLVRYEWDSFFDPSWISIYLGMGVEPNDYDPLADGLSREELGVAFDRMESAIRDAMCGSESHEDRLRRDQ